MNHPRVLVISPVVFNQENGSGVTMCNLFRGWPIDSIAQIHTSLHLKPDFNICNNYLYIQSYMHKLPRLSIIFDIFSLYSGILTLSIPIQKIIKWSRNFAPDIIYARPHDKPSFYSLLPFYLSKVLNIPYITRVLDDWPAYLETRNKFLSNKILNSALKKNLNKKLNQKIMDKS